MSKQKNIPSCSGHLLVQIVPWRGCARHARDRWGGLKQSREICGANRFRSYSTITLYVPSCNNEMCLARDHSAVVVRRPELKDVHDDNMVGSGGRSQNDKSIDQRQHGIAIVLEAVARARLCQISEGQAETVILVGGDESKSVFSNRAVCH